MFHVEPSLPPIIAIISFHGTKVAHGLENDNPVNTAIQWAETPENENDGGGYLPSTSTF